MRKYNKLIIIHIGDILKCPPALNVARLAISAGMQVTIITTNDHCRHDYEAALPEEAKWLVLHNNYAANKVLTTKALRLIRLRKEIRRQIQSEYVSDNSLIWVVSDVSIKNIGYEICDYDFVLHLMELSEKLRYVNKIACTELDTGRIARAATAIVVPSYARSHIVKAWWDLDQFPLVLPNKPVDNLSINRRNVITDLDARKLIESVSDKKIILYQGIAHKERPLRPFVDAVKLLGPNYCFVTMGAVDPLPDVQESCYLHIPYVQSPNHLQITSHAYIGVLSYFPVKSQYSILNAVFCAPNKTFEYARFGIPMLSNENYELVELFSRTNCGLAVKSFTASSIANAINTIEERYMDMSVAATDYYKSVDMQKTFKEILDYASSR